jgi:hypothetical protein
MCHTCMGSRHMQVSCLPRHAAGSTCIALCQPVVDQELNIVTGSHTFTSRRHGCGIIHNVIISAATMADYAYCHMLAHCSSAQAIVVTQSGGEGRSLLGLQNIFATLPMHVMLSHHTRVVKSAQPFICVALVCMPCVHCLFSYRAHQCTCLLLRSND